MIENMLSLIKTEIIVWAHCTNTLLSSETYDRAISIFLNNQYEYDSLLSVKEFKEHLCDENKKPLNYNPYQTRHVLARELPAYYMRDGGIFIQPYKQMLLNRYFFGKKPYLFVISDKEFLDINDEKDYLLTKAMVGNKND
jgi:CMP-N-acetylneuraminic acid synthetase